MKETEHERLFKASIKMAVHLADEMCSYLKKHPQDDLPFVVATAALIVAAAQIEDNLPESKRAAAWKSGIALASAAVKFADEDLKKEKQ